MIEKALAWFYARKGRVSYSMEKLEMVQIHTTVTLYITFLKKQVFAC